MDLKSILNNPKQRLILLLSILGLLGLVGGYYMVTNYLLPPPQETVVTTPRPKTGVETYTLTEILETLTQQTKVVFTYSSVTLGRSNPFLPVIDLSPKKAPASQVSQERPSVNISIASKTTTESRESWYKGFKLTGIIRGESQSYVIIEEGDRVYISKEGKFIKNDIYVSRISENSVVLKRGKESATLKLGGE